MMLLFESCQEEGKGVVEMKSHEATFFLHFQEELNKTKIVFAAQNEK